MPQPLHSFWIGPKLGPVHVACLKSMLAVGHSVTLHVYDAPGDRPEDIPDGVTLSDASKVLSRTLFWVHQQTGLRTMFSDFFRYALLRQEARTWVDCDVYCLKAIPEAEYIFGWLPGKSICNAILRLPPHSALLRDLWGAASDPRFVPPWLPAKQRYPMKLRRLLRLHHVSKLNAQKSSLRPAGSKALTYFVKQHGLENHALPRGTFYPLRAKDWRVLFDPAIRLEQVVQPNTVALHLYSSMPARHGFTEIPKGSIIAGLIA
jgi:hypothetical protein